MALILLFFEDSNKTMVRSTTGSVINIYDGFMNCLKLPNKEMCDICKNKKKCFRQRVKCK